MGGIQTFDSVSTTQTALAWNRAGQSCGKEVVMAPRNSVPLEEAVVEFVRKSEEAVLEVGRKWAAAVDEFMPVEVPLVQDLRKQVFDLVEELLKMQRDFAEKMLAQTRKAVVGTTKPAPVQAPKKRVHKAA